MAVRPPVSVFVALGSNLGDRSAYLERGFEGLARLPCTRLLARSPIIETLPIGPPGQGAYLNAAARLRTALAPRDLLDRMLAIEAAAGRDRAGSERWGPRTLDLDLLLYADLIIDESGLTLPHPRMHERAFVLRPLASIAPEAVHPVLGLTVREMLDSLERGP